MAVFIAQANLLAQTGNTEDVNVNTFAVLKDTTPSSGELDDWTDAIQLFYQSQKDLGGLKGRANAGGFIKFYAADTGVPNYPIDTINMTFTGTAPAIDMPAEVNLCVSYANDSMNSVPRGRRRGRLYMGAWGEDQNISGRPTSTVYEGLAGLFGDYVDSVNLITGMTACIWSRTNANGYPIERVWCDNEWDIVRSRGGKSTARETVTI
uniref:Uncharacterized protein n=1 Tax=uncultured prokaryote TaxID=198431 RepID=A0A0H5Q454_9ZZZZ|nr:hypothetical protein [uncultured prokaryote]